MLRYGFLLLSALAIPVLGHRPGDPGRYEWLSLLGVSFTFLWASSLFDAYVVAARNKDSSNTRSVDQSAFWISQLLSLGSALPMLVMVDAPDAMFYGGFLFFEMGSHWSVIRWLNAGNGLALIRYALLAYGGYALAVCIMVGLGYTLADVFLVAGMLAGVRWLAVAWLWRIFDGFGSKDAWFSLLKMAFPLAAVALFSQSALLIDAYLVHARFPDAFPAYRYGSKEFPLILLLANGLSVAQSGRIASALPAAALPAALEALRSSGSRLMHIGFATAIALIACSTWVFDLVLGPDYADAVVVFDICLLLSIPRLIFPQAIVRGYRKGIVLSMSAAVELVVKVALSFALISTWGIPGLLAATVLGFAVEKAILIVYCQTKLGIPLHTYTETRVWAAWSTLLLLALALKYFWILA